MEGNYLIYGLSDPRHPDVIRYVGQTKDIDKRLRQHFSFCGNPIAPCQAWVWGLREMGREVIYTILDTAETREDARQKEQFHIWDLAGSVGLLLNGEVFDRSRRYMGITEEMDESFFSLMIAYHTASKVTDEYRQKTIIRNNIARALSNMFREHPQLTLWGYPCFLENFWPSYEHCEDFENSRKNILDELIVSR